MISVTFMFKSGFTITRKYTTFDLYTCPVTKKVTIIGEPAKEDDRLYHINLDEITCIYRGS